uniref:Uncharacterized protein n=1 Tax=Stomoxys calcitrans TaxID=35570 RepID=A0A1I8P5M7_STOCA
MHLKWILLISCVILCTYANAARSKGSSSSKSKTGNIQRIKPATHTGKSWSKPGNRLSHQRVKPAIHTGPSSRRYNPNTKRLVNKPSDTLVPPPKPFNSFIPQPPPPPPPPPPQKQSFKPQARLPTRQTHTPSAPPPPAPDHLTHISNKQQLVNTPPGFRAPLSAKKFNTTSSGNRLRTGNNFTAHEIRNNINQATLYPVQGSKSPSRNLTGNVHINGGQRNVTKTAFNSGGKVNTTSFSATNKTPVIGMRGTLTSNFTRLNTTQNTAVSRNNTKINNVSRVNNTIIPTVNGKIPLSTNITKVNRTQNTAVPRNNTNNVPRVNNTITPSIVLKSPLSTNTTKVNRTQNTAVPWNSTNNIPRANNTFTPAVVWKNPLSTSITKVNHTQNNAVSRNNTNNVRRVNNTFTPAVVWNSPVSINGNNAATPNGNGNVAKHEGTPLNGNNAQNNNNNNGEKSKKNDLKDLAKKAIKSAVKKFASKGSDVPKKKTTYTVASSGKPKENSEYTWSTANESKTSSKKSVKTTIVIVVTCSLIVLVAFGSIVYMCNRNKSG